VTSTIIISLLGLIFAVMTAILTVVIKASINWGKNTEQLAHVVSDLREMKDDFTKQISQVILNKTQEHGEIKERLSRLERSELETLRKERRR
jgi:Tfp pilus assembly protein PilO